MKTKGWKLMDEQCIWTLAATNPKLPTVVGAEVDVVAAVGAEIPLEGVSSAGT